MRGIAMEKAKLVDKADLYSTVCNPLPEQFDAAPEPAPPAPSVQGCRCRLSFWQKRKQPKHSAAQHKKSRVNLVLQ